MGTTVGVGFSQPNDIMFGGDGSSTTVSLPANILNNYVTNGPLRLTYASFRNGNLFNTSQTSEVLGGAVIAARIVNLSVDGLEDPVKTTFTKSKVSSSNYTSMSRKCPSLDGFHLVVVCPGEWHGSQLCLLGLLREWYAVS